MKNEIEKAIDNLKTADRYITHNPSEIGDNWLDISNTIDDAIELFEKQIAKSGANQGMDAQTGNWVIDCPNCGARVEGCRKIPSYCANCGQKLKWESEIGEIEKEM